VANGVKLGRKPTLTPHQRREAKAHQRRKGNARRDRALLQCQPLDDFEAFRMSTVHLSRIDPARNMCRFYWIDVQPDLFGGFAVVKEWGRIGARGRMMDEWHMTEAEAHFALQRQAERKRRRGYR
jgi:predicted DNA-binding WGR domain protein